MIAIAKPFANDVASSHVKFLDLLPQIRNQARLAFRAVRPELKEELLAEVVANAYCAFARLVERGKLDLAFATPLAQFAIRQVRAGRRVGAKLNGRDITSRHAQLINCVTVERLDKFDREENDWQEVLVEDRHAGPAETAAARIDIPAWFRSLPRRNRKIARKLAQGEVTSAVAEMFDLSPARVSQLRREFMDSWQAFHGELAAGERGFVRPARWAAEPAGPIGADYLVPDAAGCVVFALAGSSHSILQFGRAFCRAATPAAVTFVSVHSGLLGRCTFPAVSGRTPPFSGNTGTSAASLVGVTDRIPA